ncbi:MAG TPA: hypothetical protein VMY39_01170, partial [Planctomycetota bacterium]|nr:hypothetical protein [Planctomycetota bacterium]
WDGTKWSRFIRATNADTDVGYGQLTVDGWGTKHALWWETDTARLRYSTTRDQKISQPEEIASEGTNPIIRADASGRVFMCWGDGAGDHLRVWNGEKWSTTLQAEDLEGEIGLCVTDDGRAFLTSLYYGTVTIKEALVNEEDQ